MTVYTGFTALGSPAANTIVPIAAAAETNAAKLAPYCSEGIALSSNGYQLIWALPSLILEGWCSFYLYGDNAGGAWGQNVFLKFTDFQNNLDVLFIASSATAGTAPWELVRAPNITLAFSSAQLSCRNVRYRVDIHWKIADSGGIFEVFIDGALFVTFTGDTLGNVSAGVSAMYLRQIGSATAGVFSAIIVADEDTRGIKFTDLAINGNGGLTGMTGGFADVDGTGVDDADGLTFTAANQHSTFTKAALHGDFSTGHSILGLTTQARSKRGSLSAMNMRSTIRSSGVQTSGADLAIAPVYLATGHIATVDPNTGSAWTISSLNAAEVGVESRP